MLTTAESTRPPVSAAPSATAPPVMIGSKPTLVTTSSDSTQLRFLIMDAPRESNLHLYIKECRKHHVTDVVRVCEPTYPATGLESAGISLHELPYPDGHSPPKDVLDKWLRLVDERFVSSPPSPAVDAIQASHSGSLAAVSASPPCIAVHCVAGLGRAPVLVAIALIEFAKLDPVDAVSLIRRHRRGAINGKQLNWLERYQRSYRASVSGKKCCVVM
mmetsp:Transcript_15544/g.18439  ORF Transcript_15544/g.18439 Transcript_15544/m.18439 type:complete len:217 (+) Transcript_15544:594-1244(+)